MGARAFAPGERLVREGQHPATRIYFLLEGAVRVYYLTDGAEHTRNFTFEGRFATAYDSVLTGCPARITIEALEPVRTLHFDGALLAAMYRRHPIWEHMGRRIAERIWLEKEDKEHRLRVYSAEEHYRLLIERGWQGLERVPLRHVASYLGVTPETLSRIRARMRTEPGGVDAAS